MLDLVNSLVKNASESLNIDFALLLLSVIMTKNSSRGRRSHFLVAMMKPWKLELQLLTVPLSFAKRRRETYLEVQ